MPPFLLPENEFSLIQVKMFKKHESLCHLQRSIFRPPETQQIPQ